MSKCKKYLVTKCNNHLTMVDLTKMTVENAPDNIESIKIEGSNPSIQQNQPVLTSLGPGVIAPAGVTVEPSTSDEKAFSLSLSVFLLVSFLYL